MALNPPISMAGVPLRLEGEYMMLERKEIEGEFKIPIFGKKTAKGKLYITTARMVFVNKDFAKNDFKSFDIPLLSLNNEKFEQPIFGSNYLSGIVKPIHGLLPGDTTFKLWFTSGGCQTFLNCFCRVIDQIRKGGAKGPDQKFIDQVRLGQFAGQKGFVDPNDPSVIYVSQPNDTYNNVFTGKNSNQNPNYYGQNYADPAFKGQGTILGSDDVNVQKQMQMQMPEQNQPQPQPNYNQPAPNYNQAPPNYNQPLPNYNQSPPNYNQPPSNYIHPQPNLNQQPEQYNQPQIQPNQPMNQPLPQFQNNPQFVPPPEFLSSNQQPANINQNENINQRQVPQNQNNQVPYSENQQPNIQQQQAPNLNVGYYYGFPFGPQLKKNF